MDCHMMVSEPAKVCSPSQPLPEPTLTHLPAQWVDDIADAGGASYTFHIEATCSSPFLCHPATSLSPHLQPTHYPLLTLSTPAG